MIVLLEGAVIIAIAYIVGCMVVKFIESFKGE